MNTQFYNIFGLYKNTLWKILLWTQKIDSKLIHSSLQIHLKLYVNKHNTFVEEEVEGIYTKIWFVVCPCHFLFEVLNEI
jgi:hypothetical protein